MGLFTIFSILIVLTALCAYVNARVLKLPATIGLMVLALITSLLVVAVGSVYPLVLSEVRYILSSFDFSELLLGSMLSFMLFAGAIHIKLDLLKQERLSVITFSTISVILSTFLVGVASYFLLLLFKVPTNFINCLLFGALISPTDPIAVLGILKEAKISKSLEMKIAGESLFNDGVAVVIFLTILQVAGHPAQFQWSDVAILFIREAIGGIILGFALGFTGFAMMRGIDNYKVEVLITLAVVMGGYSLANAIQVSGPLAMVVSGIIIGNQGRKHAMSENTAEHIDTFWEMADETLNAILFVLIGLEFLLIQFDSRYIFTALIAIVIILIIRYVSIFLPAQIIKLKEEITQRTIIILTWGGLRGGISIALALSLKPELQRDLWVFLTYIIVAFSILVQGLTIGKLNRAMRMNSSE